tara:strand:+ start:2811 stop:3017 length:207 start_codon:yes stop_codon:yes gene_type:complete
MDEEFEHDLLTVMHEHYGDNFSYNWDSENEDGLYIRLKVWGKKLSPSLTPLENMIHDKLSKTIQEKGE